jgi:cysteine desulfurase / selenocysteine lyase
MDKLSSGLIREDFPIFQTDGKDNSLVYLDSGASAQKPLQVIEAVDDFYRTAYANIHRGVYALSEEATRRYEGARKTVQSFLNAPKVENIVFVRGTTEAINMIASGLQRSILGEGDEVLITHMEHHSNIVPWQMACEASGATLRVAPINDHGELMMDEFSALLNERTKIVAVTHVSNALGTINPVKEITRQAHDVGAVVVIDGAQAVPHIAVDVQDIGCDYYVFSGHKTYGPTGIGALYGKTDLLEDLPPYQGGGDMIESVTFEKTTYAPLPARLEAGTPNIAGAIGLGAAIDYVTAIGFETLENHAADLLAYGTKALEEIPGLRMVGQAAEKVAVFSFVLDGIHPHDVGTIFGTYGVAVRTGHHCAQPVMDRFQVPATTRASLGLYNSRADIDALVSSIHELRKFFGK